MSLAEILNCSRLTSIVDIGASPVDGAPPYKPMLDEKLCTVLGFEPNPKALAQLNASKGPLETYLPIAIGQPGVTRAYLCKQPGMNSMLEPNSDVLKCFPSFSEWGQIEETCPCELRALDDMVSACDLLKIDIQGGELEAFGTGTIVLDNLVAVHTEVSFVPLYQEQPTFGEIDQKLRRHGLIPHAFAEIKKWMIAPLHDKSNKFAAMNQLLEADIIYVRDFTKMDLMSDEQLQHLAMIAHYCYGSKDLAVRCLTWLTKRGKIESSAVGKYLNE